MIAGPLAFSVQTVLTPQDAISAADPAAGPPANTVANAAQLVLGSAAGQVYLNFMDQAPDLNAGQREVLTYVQAHAPKARIQMGVELGTWGADPYVLNSTARVAAFGGYTGLDPSPTQDQLTIWANDGELGYVLLPGPLLSLARTERAHPITARQRAAVRSAGTDEQALQGRVIWLARNCSVVPGTQIGPDSLAAGVLFDCQE